MVGQRVAPGCCHWCRNYSFQHRYDEAIAECQLAIRIKPTSESAFYELGLVYNSARRYDDAIKAYQSAAKLNPNAYWIYDVIGLAYSNVKRYDQAIINYQHSIRLSDPREYYTDPYTRLIACYTVLHRFPKGIAYFRHLISNLGEDRIPVIKIFDETRILDNGQTKSTLAHHALGMLLARSGNRKSALEQYKILKSQGSGHPESEPAKLAEELFNEIYE